MKSDALASFWRCYDELPGHVQRLARKNFELFKANPRHPSLGFQKKGGVYTVEVGRSYRAIIVFGRKSARVGVTFQEGIYSVRIGTTGYRAIAVDVFLDNWFA